MSKKPVETRETEIRSERFEGLEDWSTGNVLSALLGGQVAALHGVAAALDDLELAVDEAASRLAEGEGRLVYSGAGTSGRLAMLDGIELTPTFGWPRERIEYLFAGGSEGLSQAVEGAEDDETTAQREVLELALGFRDVVIAVAASGTTPYTRKVVKEARETGALTISMACNPDSPMLGDAEIGVLLRSGPEVLAGSTRLGAGTAQKAALSIFSTALMTRLNKVHKGYMVDMLATNDKLVDRALRMVMALTDCADEDARAALGQCDYHVKTAVLLVCGVEIDEVEALLAKHKGHLGDALASLKVT